MEIMDRSSHYWYRDAEDGDIGVRVLEAMREYRAAESAMRRRTQQSMAMGENELLVLRLLSRTAGTAAIVTPVDIARYLGISTASTTALLDRLERSGHVVRSPHPTDRRKVVVTSTGATDDEIRATLTEMHARMREATASLDDDEARVIVSFLERLREAVDKVDAVEHHPVASA